MMKMGNWSRRWFLLCMFYFLWERCSDKLCHAVTLFEMTLFVSSATFLVCYTFNTVSSNIPTNTSVVQAYVSYKKLQKKLNFWNLWYLPAVPASNIAIPTFAKMPSSPYTPSIVNSKISFLMHPSSCILSSSLRPILHVNAMLSSSLLTALCLKPWSTSLVSMIP